MNIEDKDELAGAREVLRVHNAGTIDGTIASAFYKICDVVAIVLCNLF